MRMRMYVKKSSTLYKFLPKSGRTDYHTLRYAFDFLEEGDYVLDDEGNIYFVIDAGELNPGFLESSRVIEVQKVDFNQLPEQVKNAIYNLASGYPQSEICKKVLEIAQQG